MFAAGPDVRGARAAGGERGGDMRGGAIGGSRRVGGDSTSGCSVDVGAIDEVGAVATCAVCARGDGVGAGLASQTIGTRIPTSSAIASVR